MKKILFIAISIILTANHCFSQKDLFKDAEYFYASEEYEEAVYLFLEIGKQQPENANIQFMTGMCFLNIPGKEANAIPYLEKAIKNTRLNYREGDYRNTKAPHHALFYLGNAYRLNNELGKAIESYLSFMDIPNFDRNYNIRIVEEEIHSCQRAKIIKDSPIKLKLIHLSSIINSAPENYQPVLNHDETIMVFMQKQKFYDAVMYTEKKDGEWIRPVNITPQIGSDGEMTPTALSPDGKTLLLTRNMSYMNKDIYISEWKDGIWSKARDLSKKINTLKNEDHASFCQNGNAILFSSDRKKSVGGLDLFITKKEGDSWSTPKNLGRTINTEKDETCGYMTNDDQCLFFSSTAHFNMGGYDIFYSKKQEGNWSNPVNIGYPLNTTGDNKFFHPSQKGLQGYMSLYKQKKNINDQDIYKIFIENFFEDSE